MEIFCLTFVIAIHNVIRANDISINNERSKDKQLRTRKLSSVYIFDITNIVGHFFQITYFQDIFTGCCMGREMRQLQVQRFRGIMRRNDILRLFGDDVGQIVVSILDRMMVADPTM